MNFRTALLVIILAGAISVTTAFIYHSQFKTKIGYVDIKKVFNGFQMKKELEEKYQEAEKGRAKILDSLSFALKLMSKELNEQKNSKKGVDKDLVYQFEYERNEFLKRKNQFAEDNSVLSRKYDSQILEQMTQYIIEYGKKNNYEVILGTDGSGNLMYARESFNISEEVITYINNKYKGVE